MLLCVFCENGFTILNVEYSERYVPVWLCLLSEHIAVGFTFFLKAGNQT